MTDIPADLADGFLQLAVARVTLPDGRQIVTICEAGTGRVLHGQRNVALLVQPDGGTSTRASFDDLPVVDFTFDDIGATWSDAYAAATRRPAAAEIFDRYFGNAKGQG